MPARREVLSAALAAGAFLALRALLSGTAHAAGPSPFGPVRPDPARILDLPEGFCYRVISRAGTLMDDGLPVPAGHDGMAAFDAGNGRVALICNHELKAGDAAVGPFPSGQGASLAERIYDLGLGRPLPGGTTTLIYDPDRKAVEKHFLSLAGTERNCAGGPTPWGSWLSCEESVSGVDGRHGRSHGWVFEVSAGTEGLAEPIPLRGLGRFRHEAAAVDPRTGIVYLTEDRPDSLFYRFLPRTRGKLAEGGQLQALALVAWPRAHTGNRAGSGNRLVPGFPLEVRWIDLENTEAPRDDLRARGHAAGAARFVRGEGICHGPGGLYFACTTGGAAGAGQIFRYRPAAAEGEPGEENAPGMLELFVESTDRRVLEHCDNLVLSPWGDLIVCEDARHACGLVGITAAGHLYPLARNSHSRSELAGACFAPDGRTLFVNIQARGLTLAITGPFPATAGSSPA